jgi:hypothetical protein
MLDMLPLAAFLFCVWCSFLLSARGLEFLLFDWGKEALLQSQWGVLSLCALWEAGILAPAE